MQRSVTNKKNEYKGRRDTDLSNLKTCLASSPRVDRDMGAVTMCLSLGGLMEATVVCIYCGIP